MNSAAGIQYGSPAAPVEVLRAVAHELRQPLSNIESIAYYLKLVSPCGDRKVKEQLSRIEELVEQSHWILSSALQLACPAALAPEDVDLEEIITEAVSLRPALSHAGFCLELAGELPLVRLDPGQGRRLVDLLLMLFRQIAAAGHRVTLRTCACPDGSVQLEIQSSVPGYRSESSLGPGAALAIESARRIAGAHGGRLESSVDPETGIRLSVLLR
jgi:signal transduction histidine kinase